MFPIYSTETTVQNMSLQSIAQPSLSIQPSPPPSQEKSKTDNLEQTLSPGSSQKTLQSTTPRVSLQEVLSISATTTLQLSPSTAQSLLSVQVSSQLAMEQSKTGNLDQASFLPRLSSILVYPSAQQRNVISLSSETIKSPQVTASNNNLGNILHL